MLKISPQNPRQEFKHRLTVLIRFLETGYFIFVFLLLTICIRYLITVNCENP